MEALNGILPIVIYILLIGLIIIGIVLGIKLIIAMNKIEAVIDDAKNKLDALDGIFNIIEVTSGKLTSVYETAVDFITGMVEKIFFRKKERIEDEDE